MDNFDPYNVFLAIATNIPQRLKTGFVLQGHICVLERLYKNGLFSVGVKLTPVGFHAVCQKSTLWKTLTNQVRNRKPLF